MTFIFTDGSKSSTRAGWSVSVPSRWIVISQSCSSLLSRLTTELMAIVRALEWILENDLPQNNYLILYDYTTALQRIKKAHFKSISTHLKQRISLHERAKNLSHTVVLA